jgi:parallel beta-helix repeat protein
MLNNRKRFLFSAALAGVLVLLAGGANALANTVWCVPSTSISSACTSGGGHIHIQSAVYAASEGDVILVGPGTYHETVYIDTDYVYIFGAQAGRDARTRSGLSKESIVDASPGAYGDGGGAAFHIEEEVYNVVIDGFTVQGGNSTGGSYGSGIIVGLEAYTIQILNNIIQNNAIGLYMYYPYAILVEHNLFQNNNNGPSGSDVYEFSGESGIGIAVYDDAYGTTITENAFEGNLGTAMWIYDADYLEITRNTSEKDGSFVAFYDCDYVYFDHNQGKDFGALGIKPVYGEKARAAVDLTYYNGYMQINNNVLDKGKVAGYNGISFSAYWGAYYVGYYSHVSNNTITRFAGNGIVAQPAVSAPYYEYSTLYLCMIAHNDVEDNGKDGILIGNGEYNYYNAVFDNKAEGNGRNDCEDDTVNDLTAGTYNTWFNNIGSLSSPGGLCTQGGWWQ